MTRVILPAAFVLAFTACAIADAATTTFTDPAEQAFTVQVPKGWQVKGGVYRRGPIDAPLWLSVATADRSTILFIGDPSIPGFVHTTRMGPMGRPLPLPKRTVEAPYETGRQFAADYGNKVLPRLCTNVQLKDTQPDEKLAQQARDAMAATGRELGMSMPMPQTEGGSALFACQANGRTLSTRIMAVTQMAHTPFSDNWHVAVIKGFTTPAGLEDKAQGLLTAMGSSIRWSADWKSREVQKTQQMIAPNNQFAAQQMQIQANNARAESQMLYNQYRSSSDMLTANHNAFMQQQAIQRDNRNAAFAQHMYQKSVGQQNEMMYIQNQQCIHRVYNQPGNACNVYVQH